VNEWREDEPAPPAEPPGAVASLVCGIISIVTCWLPIVPVILGVIAIVQSNKARRLPRERPQAYRPSGLATAGLVCGIIGTVLGALYLVYWLVVVVFVTEHMSEFDTFREEFRKGIREGMRER